MARRTSSQPNSTEVATHQPKLPEEALQEGELLAPYHEAQKNQKVEIQLQRFSGPMPSPQILHGYQALVPDAPERILKQYELDAAHLREVSILALRSEIGDTRRAQWIACGLVVFGLAIATWLAFSKHTEVAVAIVVTLLVTVVINFLNSYKQEQPQEEKTTTPAKSRKKSKEK